MFNKRTLAERLLAAALCLVLLVGMLPTGALPAFAAEDNAVGTNEETAQPSEPTGETTAPSTPAGDSEEETEPTENKKGTVTALIDGLKITDDQDGNVTVSIADTLKLKWIPVDASIGRNEAGWRVGFSIAAPEGMTDVSNAKFDYAKPNGTVAEGQLYTDYSTGTTLNVWPLITEDLVKKGDVSCSITIDWNGDGTNVQTVEVQLEQDKLILLDEAGKMVYPFGTVTNNLGVEATYDNPADIKIDVSGKKLKYDAEKGGWFVTATVTASAVVDPTKATVNGMPFSDDASKYSVEYTQTLTAENNAVNLIGEFDWDGNGEVDQVIAITGTVELEKAEQDKPEFSTNKAEIVVSYDKMSSSGNYPGAPKTYTNGVVNGTAEYSYEDKYGIVTDISSNGVITFVWNLWSILSNNNNTLTITVTAKFAETETHKEASSSYKLTIQRNQIPEFGFNTESKEVTYGQTVSEWPKANYAYWVRGVTVKYTSSDNTVATVNEDTGVVTIWKAGTVTITATGTHEDYVDTKATYELVIHKADQELTVAGPDQILMGETGKYTIDGVKADGQTTVTTSDETIATAVLQDDGTILVTPIATGNVQLIVNNAGNENYNPAVEVRVDIAVRKKQSNIAFEKDNESFELIYNYNEEGVLNQFTNAITGAEGTGALTYESSNPEIAEVNEDGVVTIRKSSVVNGNLTEVTITATKAGDDEYAKAVCEYTLTIKKADQVIDFTDADGEAYITNSEETYAIEMSPEESWYSLDQDFAFTVVSKDDKLSNTDVDGNSGVVTIGEADHGVIKIKVTRAGDDCFNDWAGKTYTLTIGQIAVSGNFVFSGTVGLNGWYTSYGDLTHTGGYLLAVHETKHNGQTKHEWKDKYRLENDGEFTLNLCLKEKDNQGATCNVSTGTIKIDTTDPVSTISYSEAVGKADGYLFYQNLVEVMINASDSGSGLAYIYYRIDDTADWIQVPVSGKNAECSFEIQADYLGKVSYYAVDVAGNTEDGHDSATIVVENDKPLWLDPEYTFASNQHKFENGIYYTQGDVTVKMTISEKHFALADKPVVKLNGKAVDVTWTNEQNTDKWTAEVVIAGDGDHTLSVEFSDKSTNKMDTYEQEFHIDSKAPIITIGTLPENPVTGEIFFTVTVEEHNFDRNATTIIITGLDASGNPVMLSDNGYTVSDWEQDGDVYTAKVTLNADSIYTIKVNSTDLAENAGQEKTAGAVLDNSDPVFDSNTGIAYSDAVNVWEDLLEKITFGAYNAERKLVITVTASDAFSGVASVTITYEKLDGTTGKMTVAADNGVAVFTLPDEEIRSVVTVEVTDAAGNTCDPVTDDDRVNIIDMTAPEIKVTHSAENGAVTVDGNTTLYFQSAAVYTIRIKEYNFDNKDEVVIKDYNTVLTNITWTQVENEENVWETVLTLDQEGDHKLTVSYVDNSDNVAIDVDTKQEGYVSDKIVVDYTNPVISLDLEETPDRLYFADTKVIKLTVVERNFNASKVQYHLTAKDVSGNDLTVEPAYSEWTTASDGITHTITLTFDAEANYTLDVTYADEAGRESNDLAERLFTVDKTAPEGLTISYSTNVWGEIIDNLTFGYYNVPVTVTITANDTISGVRQFLYSYIREAGVSGVNLEKLEKLIAEAQVEQVDGGHTFRAQFKIPESELEQINGKISFTAVDYAEKQTTLADDKTLVVDNIRPNASVNYNAPVQTVGDISYYAGNIEVTLTVVEANFFAEDVKVTVTKDGISYPVEVVWSNVSVDDHIGTFTLTEDGVYEVSVTYTDRSNNTMDQYKSGELTIDTVKPEVNVSGIVNNSANTDEVYGFSITATDTNFNVEGFQPLLQMVVRISGGYSTEFFDMGKAEAVVDGNTYTFEVANLDKDALYTLTCTVMDLAGNTTTVMLLEDGKSYEKVQFSVNRNGSVFALGEYTEQLVNDYYTQNVTEDLEFIEVNVDELKSYAVTLNGEELIEGEGYTVTPEGGNGLWMKYTYTISKDLFAEEGEYLLRVSSQDKAGNNAVNDMKDASVSFVVDRTAPVITVSGMANNGRYQTDKQTVTLIPTDDGGALNSIVVRMVDDNGNMLKEILNLSGDALTEKLEAGDGKLTFEIGEGLYQNVQVICTDSAAGANGSNVYNETFTNLSVSANAFMIFWANTGLRWGVIGGTGAAALAIIFLLLGKKKKKEDKEEAK